jgi:DNA helicase-2/ATP-dependent DNA helicase PcrA
MTAHGSKGLEFDHVFVMRLCRNAFPVSRKKPLFEFPPALMKEELPKGDHHVLEERRLFYVALTRARKRLTLTTVEKERSKPSPFLEDIEQEMHALGRDVEKLVPEVSLQSSETLSEETRKIAGRMPALARTPVRAAGLFGDAAAAEYQTSRIGAWAGDYRPPVERPLELSASSVETYCGCPLKFMFDNRWGIRGRPSGSLTFGNVMHTTIRHFMKELREGRRPTVDDVLLVYEREWKSIGFEDEYQEESFREAGREQLRKFHARTMAALPAVRDLEKYFALPLANDLMLTGRIDQINALPGGAEIVDYKTGTPRTEKYVKKDLQLSVYALAAREALELSVARVAFHYLQDDSVVTAERDAKDLAEAESRIQEAAAGIRGGQFPARPQFLCRYCDFRLICPAHEQPLTAVASPSEPA